MAAQAPTSGAPAKAGPIDHKDIEDWTTRFHDHLAHTDQITAPAAADAREWNAGIFGCFNPIDTCKAARSGIFV
jgi:hypothetical protein